MNDSKLVRLEIKTYGFKYLRAEVWKLTAKGTTNYLVGIKILFFKFFVGAI